MDWTEPMPPTPGISYYDHISLETPLGRCLIEWKSWKEYDSYSVKVGDTYIGEAFDLDGAKQLMIDWLITKRDELSEMIGC